MKTSTNNKNYLYLFLDESGNFDFSNKGTKFLIFGCLSLHRPFKVFTQLDELKYDLIENKKEPTSEYFHATEDKQFIRDEVFKIISRNHNKMSFHSIILEKCKTSPSIQSIEKLYPKMLEILLKYILNPIYNIYSKVIIFTDTIPTSKRNKLLEKTIKIVLSYVLPQNITFQIYHHSSKSNYGLQVSDYITWSIFKRWNKKDLRSYDLVKKIIYSEYDIFKKGVITYY